MQAMCSEKCNFARIKTKTNNKLLIHTQTNDITEMMNQEAYQEERSLSDAEVEELLTLSRGETLEYDSSETWLHLFRRQVEAHPDSTAVVAADGSYTYRELDQASDAVASYLAGKGLQPDAFVAIRMDRSRLFMAAAIGAHKASAAYVPIDLEYPAERVEYMLEDSEAALTLTEETVREAVLLPPAPYPPPTPWHT